MDLLTRHKKALIIALAIGLWLRFALGATAVMFYELYHLTEIGPIYWGYSAFKAADYYFSIWPYQDLVCAAVVVLLVAIAAWRGARGKAQGATA
jgi:hypothetical protein